MGIDLPFIIMLVVMLGVTFIIDCVSSRATQVFLFIADERIKELEDEENE